MAYSKLSSDTLSPWPKWKHTETTSNMQSFNKDHISPTVQIKNTSPSPRTMQGQDIPVGCVCCSFFFPKAGNSPSHANLLSFPNAPLRCTSPAFQHIPLPAAVLLVSTGLPAEQGGKAGSTAHPPRPHQKTSVAPGPPQAVGQGWDKGVFEVCKQGRSLKLWVFLSWLKPLSGVRLLCKVVPPVMQMTNFYVCLFCSIYTAILDFLRAADVHPASSASCWQPFLPPSQHFFNYPFFA